MPKISQLPSDLPQTGDYIPGQQVATTSTKRFSFANIIALIFNNPSVGAPVVPTGAIEIYAAASAPTGWLLCDGSSYLRTLYPTLFTVIGTTFGAVDGTHFTVPDLRGRVAVGVGTASGANGATAHTLAQVAGEETHQLTVAELASHSHNQDAYTGGINGGALLSSNNTGSLNNRPVNNTGGDTAHNNMQPYVGLNYIIRT